MLEVWMELADSVEEKLRTRLLHQAIIKDDSLKEKKYFLAIRSKPLENE